MDVDSDPTRAALAHPPGGAPTRILATVLLILVVVACGGTTDPTTSDGTGAEAADGAADPTNGADAEAAVDSQGDADEAAAEQPEDESEGGSESATLPSEECWRQFNAAWIPSLDPIPSEVPSSDLSERVNYVLATEYCDAEWASLLTGGWTFFGSWDYDADLDQFTGEVNIILDVDPAELDRVDAACADLRFLHGLVAPDAEQAFRLETSAGQEEQVSYTILADGTCTDRS